MVMTDMGVMAQAWAGLGAPAPATWTDVIPVPDPEQPMRQGLTESDVSPGVLGFLAVFVVAVATILLVRSLTTKLRGVNRRAAEQDAQDEREAREAAETTSARQPGTDEDQV